MRRFGFISVLFLLSVSCERVLQVDLNDAEPQIVIEANVSSQQVPATVLISKTGSYFVNAKQEYISGAKVSLTVGDYSYEFEETEDTVYVLEKYKRLYDEPYHLTVQVDGKTYEAESTMPAPVRMNYLRALFSEETTSGEGDCQVRVGFTDPVDDENYYRIRYNLNGVFHRDDNDYFLLDDKLFNGNVLDISLSEDTFNENDTVQVELMSLEKPMYRYFSALEDIIGENVSLDVAPANPVSNFNNGALGYFSAYSSDIKQIVLKRP